MTNKHTKSPCCGMSVHHFGKRRRQCTACKKTWRIRKKKLGRKKKRALVDSVTSYFTHRSNTLRVRANVRGIGKPSVQRALARSLDLYVETHKNDWP